MFRDRILQMTVMRTINCYLSHWNSNNSYNYLPSFHYNAHYGFQNNVPTKKYTKVQILHLLYFRSISYLLLLKCFLYFVRPSPSLNCGRVVITYVSMCEVTY